MTTAAEIRALLLDPEEPAAMDVPGAKEAAVLIPLFHTPHGLVAVFTRRRADLRRHPGEISFPGGSQDQPDEDLRVTALREAEEEIGLPREEVELVGALPPVATFVSGYKVHPFVGWLAGRRRWTPQEAEVERVLELALADLMAGYESKRLLRRGVPVKTPTYTVDGHVVWGATGRIVQSLLARMAPLLTSCGSAGAGSPATGGKPRAARSTAARRSRRRPG